MDIPKMRIVEEKDNPRYDIDFIIVEEYNQTYDYWKPIKNFPVIRGKGDEDLTSTKSREEALANARRLIANYQQGTRTVLETY